MSTTMPTDSASVMPRFPVLDTLRAVGAFAVLTTHVAFWSGEYTRHGVWGAVLARLDVGVSLFFVLSGFLLSYPYLARARSGRAAPALGPYLWKRALRIIPVYVLTVVLALVFIDANRNASFGDWVSTLLLADVYVHPHLPQGLTQMWSLAVEVSFYLVLPLLMVAVTGARRRWRPQRVVVLLAVMVAIAVLWHLQWASEVETISPGSPREWLPTYLVWFAVGIFLALAHVALDQWPGRLQRGLLGLAALPGCCWAAAAGLMLLAATPIAGPTMLAAPTQGEALTKNLIYAAIGALIVLPGVFGPEGSRFERVFSAAALRHLGHISYGIFCIHLPVLHLVMWVTGYELFRGHGPQIWLLTVLISVGAAELIYRLVEKPAMRLKRWRPRNGLDAARANVAASGSRTT
jgi:peptidoglycan/LPS O-acetylase OafA/YrhL